MNAFIFPGQGSQVVGMGQEITAHYSYLEEYWEVARSVLGYDLKQLCFEGPAEQLTNTLYAQPALLTVGAMRHEIVRREGVVGAMTAGHSLGEYSALVAAGALSFEEALKLVKKRAELMAEAPEGAMAAVIGLPDDSLDGLLQEASAAGTVVPANYNCPGQIVISGAPAAIEAAMAAAKGHGAKMAVRLAVSGAFHSPLLAEAASVMAQMIEAAPLQNASIPVYQNTTAAPATDAEEIRVALRAQMTSPVRWTEIITRMIGDGASSFYELGPGNVLAGLLKRIDKTVTVVNL